jgi:hypothetical protein
MYIQLYTVDLFGILGIKKAFVQYIFLNCLALYNIYPFILAKCDDQAMKCIKT